MKTRARRLAAPFVVTAGVFGGHAAAELPTAPHGAKVDVRPDGTCWQFYETRCPPGARCNPPPPRQVQCPPAAGPTETVERRADGTCWAFPADFRCPPPPSTCNPPPPRQVLCPEAKPEPPKPDPKFAPPPPPKQPELPDAPPDARIIRRDDGTCVAVYDVRCPPDVACNPPAPMPVKCPPAK
ncbi:MAG: hypothetical protein H6704_27750 [Myxococcales bacterium]|nr:hypothetical protein [Myxococcales bacterium]